MFASTVAEKRDREVVRAQRLRDKKVQEEKKMADEIETFKLFTRSVNHSQSYECIIKKVCLPPMS
jgi:hypothetical protein